MKISLQTGDIVDRLGKEKGYELIRKAGFEAIDWNLDHSWKISDINKGILTGCIFEKSLDEVKEHYARELEIIRNNSLEITQAHAPFPAYSLRHPEVLDYAIGIYKRVIEYCSYAGIKNLVIHGISYNLKDENNTPESIDALNKKLYTSLIPTLVECGNVTVCLENLFSTYEIVSYQGHCSDALKGSREIDELNSIAGKEVFGLCLDTGHANLLHHDIRVFIKQYGSRIKALHIHDNDGSRDEHEAPMTGTINWNHFCQALKEICYNGDLSFETFAQTNQALDFDESMVLPWMILINETGKCFRNKINAKG